MSIWQCTLAQETCFNIFLLLLSLYQIQRFAKHQPSHAIVSMMVNNDSVFHTFVWSVKVTVFSIPRFAFGLKVNGMKRKVVLMWCPSRDSGIVCTEVFSAHIDVSCGVRINILSKELQWVLGILFRLMTPSCVIEWVLLEDCFQPPSSLFFLPGDERLNVLNDTIRVR